MFTNETISLLSQACPSSCIEISGAESPWPALICWGGCHRKHSNCLSAQYWRGSTSAGLRVRRPPRPSLAASILRFHSQGDKQDGSPYSQGFLDPNKHQDSCKASKDLPAAPATSACKYFWDITDRTVASIVMNLSFPSKLYCTSNIGRVAPGIEILLSHLICLLLQAWSVIHTNSRISWEPFR